MRLQRLAVILTVLNFLLLMVLIGQFRPVKAASDVAPVLRGRALELVDEKGRVRVTIKVFPAQPNLRMPDGTIGISEVVELRLIDSTGSPHIKLSTLEDGSGLLLGGESGYVQLLSRGPMSLIKIVNKMVACRRSPLPSKDSPARSNHPRGSSRGLRGMRIVPGRRATLPL